MKIVSWKEAVNIIKEKKLVIAPTDTLFGILGLASDQKVVESLYHIKKRNPKKPFIILIDSLKNLENFGINLNSWQIIFLKKIWPGSVSVILPCFSENKKYLHRDEKALAFRLPKNKRLIELIKKTGPLVAPSANFEGMVPIDSIEGARKFFKKERIYFVNGNVFGKKPSTLLDLRSKNIKILRKGKNFWKCFFWSKML